MYEIGRFYMIPCVKTTHQQRIGRGEWVPVLGPLHEDADIIEFPYPHWHVDWRFASKKQVQRIGRGPLGFDERRLFAVPIQYRTNDGKILLVESGPEPIMRHMQCKRQMPAYPLSTARSVWLRKLEEAYTHCRLKQKICPHRGIPLEGVEQHGDIVTCPGHGLRWNVITGALML